LPPRTSLQLAGVDVTELTLERILPATIAPFSQ
jgi:hypothetical protein